MNKVKLLSIIAISLLICNIGVVYFFVFQKNRPPRPISPKKVVIERLHFDENQEAAYSKLIEKHQNDITQTEGKIMDLKKQLYRNLSENKDTMLKDSLINELGKVQIEIENIHFQHFQEIKKLCNAQQLKAYDSLTYDIAKIFAKPPIKRKMKE